MLQVRKSDERGYAAHGSQKSFHTFSFAGYHDPEHMGFGSLRVINEDRVLPGSGFGTHGHRDMEIISYVLEGALAHEDNMGNGSSIVPGDVQRMSAGKGVLHSEYNHSKDGVTHFLQIWIEPDVTGIRPSYEQKHFDAASKRGRLRLIASSDAREGSVLIHQDASVYAALLDAAERISHKLDPARKAYVQVARGRLTVNGQLVEAGDALKASGVAGLGLEKGGQAEGILFNLA